MAKRRKLTAPDAEALRELDAGFAAKHLETKSALPPIAQVAGESAALAGMEAVADRAELAKDKADAGRFRQAEQAGLVARIIPVSEIDAQYIHRDRMHEDAEEMEELCNSIRENGLRIPIEVAPLAEGYGLISGYRRLKAYRSLMQSDMGFAEIPAFVRVGEESRDSYLRMVEENEIRSNLTPYERGRLVVLAAGQGVFASVDAAINGLFASGSRAKRSKVRSFAAVHEAIGDLLRFPTEMSERNGLALAAALREGAQGALREALNGVSCKSAAEEWHALSGALKAREAEEEPDQALGGRPKELMRRETLPLDGGGDIQMTLSPSGGRFEVRGQFIDNTQASIIAKTIRMILSKG